MTRYLAISGPRIRWRINQNDPGTYKLTSLDNFTFINPYKFSKEYQRQKLLIGTRHTVINGECHSYTTGIILRTTNIKREDYEKLFLELSDFFRHLRYYSMQVEIQSNKSVSSITTYEKITKGVVNFDKPTKMTMAGDYYFRSVTWGTIKNADKNLSKKREIPVYEEMLLEAKKGMIDHEYNKVILFSVIAVESLLAHTYYNAYEKEKKRKQKRKDLRIIKNHDGNFKDPILKSLLEGTDFKKLLHEIPLYLYKKSILTENQLLYSNILKLYMTRNKIVHWGAPLEFGDSKMFNINEASAEIALKSAVDVFNWIGINRYNELLKSKFVSLESGSPVTQR